nr:hypothetical protein [Tanacetum cinerariifolium]
MAPLTFADTYNMVTYLFESDFWAMASIKKADNVVKLQALINGKKVVITKDVIRQDIHLDDAAGVECFPNDEIFAELACMGYENAKRTAWNEFSCLMASAVIYLATVIINNQVDGLSSHTTRYTSPALNQKVFANMIRVGKGFSGVETPLFASMLVQPQPQAAKEEDDVDEQPTDTSEFSMSILNTLMETCATLSQKVAELEQDKQTQALENLKLKKRVEKLEKKRKSKHSGLKRLKKVDTSRRIKSSTNTVIDDVSAAIKDGNVAEPTVFDDEEVTMTIDLTLIKMKAKKARLLDEQMAKRLHDEEVEQAAAREKQENDDLERAKEYKKVQTLFKPDKDEEPTKKRVTEETLLQESFKKLKAVKVSGSESTHDTTTNDPKAMSEEDVQNMLEIIPVSEFKLEALQVNVLL